MAGTWTLPHPMDVLRFALGRARDAILPAPSVRVRSYGAGGVSRLTAGWTTTPENVDHLLRRELRTLRARSRDQVARNDYARRYVQLLQSNILGASGLALESLITDPDGTADVQARRAIEGAWADWGADPVDVSRSLSWRELERLALRTAATDGEFLARYLEGRQAGPWYFRLQVLDPELLDVDLNVDLRNGHVIRLGIEVDEWGAPVAYYFHTSRHGHAADAYVVHIGRAYIRVPAEEILHAFVPEWISQRRGIPWTATSLERLKMLGAYEEAALTHARNGASQLGFITREPGSAGFTGDQAGVNGDTTLDLEPGQWNELPPGAGIATYDPRYPSGEFRPFIQSILKGISAGLGPAYTSLAQDLEGTSYAGGRMGLLEERELYRYLQSWLAASVARPVFQRWLRWALVANRVTHPATGAPLPFARLDKFRAHEWRGKRWPWVDPRNDAQAAELMIRSGLTTESRVLRELGMDPSEVWEERQLELEERRRRGIRTSTDVALEAEPTGSEDPPTEDPDAPLAASGREVSRDG